ncbi:MAG: hypothetical protein Q4G23_11775, partial [Clostridia bacterium]|nr:hypothetical protein [Clostridia bacterium]
MKGIIVEVKENSAVMLNEKGEFKRIKNRSFTVGEKINYKSRRPAYYAASSFVLAVSLLSASIYGFFVPVSYVDIDINPSLRMEVNCFERVVGYEALNSDGEKVITGLKNGIVSECIKDIITVSENMGYLTDENNEADINVVTSKNKLMTKIEKTVLEMGGKGFRIYVHREDKETLERAKVFGVSVGKYSAIEDYTEACGGSFEENAAMLKEKSVWEIKDEVVNESAQAEKKEEGNEEKVEKAEDKAGKKEERA